MQRQDKVYWPRKDARWLRGLARTLNAAAHRQLCHGTWDYDCTFVLLQDAVLLNLDLLYRFRSFHCPAMDVLLNVKPSHAAVGCLLTYTLYHVARAIYLLYLSPVSIYPGSSWAALSE